MRIALLFALLSAPLPAWEYSPLPICTVSEMAQDMEVVVTFDPATDLYAINLTRDEAWANGPTFSLGFTGGRGVLIRTDRHTISNDGRTISVVDTGFGNVLNGLQYNDTMRAYLGDDAYDVSLIGAADPVARFRTCGAALTG